ncbi:acyl-CoA N-acyltransferase [Pyrenochaeta sp. MPI-SDFR-AT-0127]|nr:acyl-CoA N-acyltransferase [Pyrenochaeta sp. MPI-SDFR-AT-0127]
MASSDNLTFRLATEDDAVPLERLINTAFRDDKTTQVFLSTDHASIDVTSAKQIQAKICQPDCAVYVATDSVGTLLAHGSVRKFDTNCAWFGMLAVDVNHQNRGLGRKVLAYAENYAMDIWGSARMKFDVVSTRAELIAWYKRQGYQETGETTPFPYEHHGDWKEILRDDLHFVIFSKELKLC